ncbi:MAG: hypothetical protein J7484_10275 [Microbacterium sp.]|nr:hypothetical protein [Microbacterium sp.]
MSMLGRPSPRTAAEPMAFTNDELMRGGLWAWAYFLLLLVLGMGVLSGLTAIDSSSADPGTAVTSFLLFAVVALIIGAPVSLILMPVGVMLAKPLGHLLRRTRRMSVHVVVYAALGAAVGFGYIAIFRGDRLWAPLAIWDGIILVPAIAVAVAVPLGWWHTARRALDEDSGLRQQRRRVDADAVIEDAATDEPH